MIDQAVNLLVSLCVMAVVLCMAAVALLGWGRLTLKLIGFELCPRPDTVTVWLGLGIVLGLVDFLHLFFPVDWKMTVGLGLIGLLGCTVSPELQCRSLINLLRLQLCKNRLITAVGSLILILWCLRAMGVPNNYDSGLYHFQTIRWLNEFPLVPGLGNLHWRFAFNQSHFNFLALLNFAPYWGKGYAIGGLFLLLLSAATVVEFGQKQSKTWRWVFGGLLFIYFGYVASGVSNPAPDGVIGLVQVVAFLLLFRILEGASQYVNDESPQRERDTITLSLLCLTMTTIKLTGALFALVCIAIVLWINRHLFRQYLKKWMILLVLLLMLSIIHLGRSYLLSGFPLFPGVMLGALDLPWSMPIELVKFEANLIKSWARMPGVLDPDWALASWAWLPIWIKAMSFWTAALLVSALVLMMAASSLVLVDKMRRARGGLFLLYLPLYATLIFWFVTAPDPRFLGSILVLSIALSLWFLIAFIQSVYKQPRLYWLSNKVLTALGIVFCCLATLKLTGLNSISTNGWPHIPSQAMEVKQTLSGLYVSVPLTGPQCWDEALPCVSIFNENLVKRKSTFSDLNRFRLMNDFYFTNKLSNPK